MLILVIGVLFWLMWVCGFFVNFCFYFGFKELDDVGDFILSCCWICYFVKLFLLNVGNFFYFFCVVKLIFKLMGG